MGSEQQPHSLWQTEQPYCYLLGIFRFKAIAIGFLILFLLTSISWAGTISGPSSFCMTSSGYTATYTAVGFTGATSYNWSVPSFASILSGQNTSTITVKFSSTTAPTALIYLDAKNGNIHVGSYGLYVTLFRQAGAAGAISGPASVCAGQTNVEYSVPTISNATQYSWILPSGASIASQSGNTVKVNFSSSFTSGTLRVYGIAGACGTSTISSYTISKVASPSTPGAISGKSLVATGETNVTYSIPAIANASNYQWTVPSGATITSGQGTRTIKVNFSSAFQSGNIIVHGLNGGCVGPASAPLYVALSNLPGPVGSITGNSTPCVGTSGSIVTYSISPVTNENPLGYSWTLGPGMVPLGNPNLGGDPRTNVMRVRFLGNASVTTTSISVYNKNSYGSGPASTKNIRVYRPAATPAHIAGPINIAEDQVEATYSVSSIENASPLWFKLAVRIIEKQKLA